MNAVAVVSGASMTPAGKISIQVSASVIDAGVERNLGTTIEMDFLASAVQIRNTVSDGVKAALASSFGVTLGPTDTVLVFGAPL